MENNPFPGTVIADWNFLDSSPRSQCPKCKKSRKYYCYTCYAPLPHLTSGLPNVKLPVKVDIIKHPGETDGKSTAPHAVILAPEDVAIHTYPCIPDYDTTKVVLVFPGEHSITLDELAAAYSEEIAESSLLKKNERNKSDPTESRTVDQGQVNTSDLQSDQSDAQLLSETDASVVNKLEDFQDKKAGHEAEDAHSGQCGDSQSLKRSLSNIRSVNDGGQMDQFPSKKIRILPSLPFERVVFIDATWNQTHNIVCDERLKDLKKVEIRTRNSNFWRTQEGVPKTYLSTIEAIYYFIKDLHTLFLGSQYKNEYDNLLFFFSYMHNKIHSSKVGKGIKANQR